MIEKVTDWYSFFSLSPEERAENARHMENPPKGTVDAVLDTDTYNEVDDQFALAYLLKSSDRVRTRAIYAAPFYNQKSDSPKDGMEKSFCEIGRVLDVMGLSQEYGAKVFKGSDRFLEDESEPVDSPLPVIWQSWRCSIRRNPRCTSLQSARLPMWLPQF